MDLHGRSYGLKFEVWTSVISSTKINEEDDVHIVISNIIIIIYIYISGGV